MNRNSKLVGMGMNTRIEGRPRVHDKDKGDIIVCRESTRYV